MRAVQCNKVSCVISKRDISYVQIELDNCWQNKNDFPLHARESRATRSRDTSIVKPGVQFSKNFVRMRARGRANSYNIYSKQFSAPSRRRDATAFLFHSEEKRLIVNLNLSNREFKSGRVWSDGFSIFFPHCHLSRWIKRPFIIMPGLMNDFAILCMYTILCGVSSAVW